MSIVQKKAYLHLDVWFWKPLAEKGVLFIFYTHPHKQMCLHIYTCICVYTCVCAYIYMFKVLFTTSLYV